MFMQLWSPTVIHPSLSKTYTLKELDPQQQMYPQRNLLECFQDGWTNRVTQVFRSSSLHQRSNWTFDTYPQKTRCHSCKQTIYNPTTTVPSSEIPTFDGIADQRLVQNSLCKLFVVLHSETGRAFNSRKKEHLRNTKTAAKGSRIANHAWSNNHAIDFENASIIDKGIFRTRKT